MIVQDVAGSLRKSQKIQFRLVTTTTTSIFRGRSRSAVGSDSRAICMKFLTPFATSRLITTSRILQKMSRQHNRSNKSTRDQPRQGRREDNPTVALSKQLSWILRHGLEKSGLQVRTDGYVRLDELVSPQSKVNFPKTNL
jgi:hypothetical protein